RGSPHSTPEDFDETIARLSQRLDEAQLATARLDQQWARLDPSDVSPEALRDEGGREWWEKVGADPESHPERVQAVLRSYDKAREAMRSAEETLRPWVIRHLRPRSLEDGTPRRDVVLGAAIQSNGREVADGEGLGIGEEALLPFL